MTDHRLIDHGVEDEIEYEDVGPHQRYTLALDEDGDLQFNPFTNTFQTIHDEDAVKQSLKVALGTVKGEDPFDPEFGIDVFRATRSFRQIEREVRRVLMHDDIDHDRVQSVENVNITRVGRQRRARVFAQVELDTGEIEEIEIDLGVAL